MALLQTFSEEHVVAFMLVLGRIAPLFVLAPLFNSRMFPARVKGVAAVALSVGLSPIALKQAKVATDAMSIGGLMLKEILVGMAFAFAIAVLFAAVSAAGSFLDTMIGFSFGSLVDPVSGSNSAVISQLYGLVAVAVFIAVGGDGWVIRGLARTYDLIPLNKFPDLGALVGGAQHVFSSIFVSAIAVAAPVLIALIITDAGFGMVSRVVPQINVFAVGFPAKILVGFLLISASMPFVAGWVSNQLQQSVQQALASLHVA
jgi:flagellar biosynthetic protein FliR